MDYIADSRGRISRIYDKLTTPKRIANTFPYFAITKMVTKLGGTNSTSMTNGFSAFATNRVRPGNIRDPFGNLDLFGSDGVIDADSLWTSAGYTNMDLIYNTYRVLSSKFQIRVRNSTAVVTTRSSEASDPKTWSTPVQTPMYFCCIASAADDAPVSTWLELRHHPWNNRVLIPTPKNDGTAVYSKWLTVDIPNHATFMHRLFQHVTGTTAQFDHLYAFSETSANTAFEPHIHMFIMDKLASADLNNDLQYEVRLYQEVLMSKSTGADVGVADVIAATAIPTLTA